MKVKTFTLIRFWVLKKWELYGAVTALCLIKNIRHSAIKFMKKLLGNCLNIFTFCLENNQFLLKKKKTINKYRKKFNMALM